MHNLDHCAYFELLCIFWITVHILDHCAYFESLCVFWSSVHILNHCASLCIFWITVHILDRCAYFGSLCIFWITVRILDHCAYFRSLCIFWINVHILEHCEKLNALRQSQANLQKCTELQKNAVFELLKIEITTHEVWCNVNREITALLRAQGWIQGGWGTFAPLTDSRKGVAPPLIFWGKKCSQFDKCYC